MTADKEATILVRVGVTRSVTLTPRKKVIFRLGMVSVHLDHNGLFFIKTDEL